MLREVVEGRPRASEVPAQRISEIKLKKRKRYCREETELITISAWTSLKGLRWCGMLPGNS